MKNLWTSWDEIKKKVSPDKKKLIFLDFDGTLVSIAESPDAVRMDAKTKTLLKSMAADGRVQLAIISGRPLKQLRHFLRIRNLIVIGNHGLEIHGGGIHLPKNAKKARKLKYMIGILSQKLQMVFRCFPGVWVEYKNYTLSVHYRHLPKGHGTLFDELIRFFKKKYVRYPLTWIRGKKVVEVRPSTYWGKGETVQHLIRRFPKAVPVGIGDDRADEDMFRVLKDRRGIPIRVGYSRSSSADYYLNSPQDVKNFLQMLCS